MTSLNSRGVTMVEGMLTILLVGIAMVGLMRIYTTLGGNAVTTNRTVVANALARSRLESLLSYKKANGYSGALLAVGTTSQTISFNESATGTPRTISYTLSTEIKYVQNNLSTTSSIDTGFKRLDISVTQGTANTVTLSSIVSNTP